MKFTSRTDADRKLALNWTAINAYLSRWRPGTEVEIEITRAERKVSNPQRRYYFSTVLPVLLEATGYDPDEALLVHKHLKILFFNVAPDSRGIYRDKDIPSVFGNESDVPISVKTKFIDWVMRKCSEYGAYVPSPCEDERRAA
jgi:hypothetical protein